MNLEDFRRLLLDVLSAGGGLDELVHAAGQYLGTGFCVCDAAYTLLASTDPGADDGVFVVQASQRWVMRPEIVEEMQRKGITRRLQTTREAFSMYNPACGLWEVFCSLMIRRQVAGYLFLRVNEPPASLWLGAWTALAQALSIELQKGAYVTPGPLQPVRAEILRQLVEGQISQEDLILKRLHQTGWKAAGPFRLGCLVGLAAPLFSSLSHDAVVRQVEDLLPESLCCISREHLVLLCPAGLLDPGAGADPVKLLHWLQYHQLGLAVSMPFGSLLDAPRGHAQAQAMVDLLRRCAQGRAVQSGDSIFRFEEQFPLSNFLKVYSIAQIPQCIHPHIWAFREHDRTRRTEYLPTLRAYFENNRSTTAAAAALYIHKTTLFYRLEQMEKLAGPFLKDPGLLFLYEYSLLLLKLLPGETPPPADPAQKMR